MMYKECCIAYEACDHQYANIVTTENRELDTIIVTPKSLKEIPIKDRQYNLHILGAGTHYERKIEALYRQANKQEVVNIAFNFANISRSKGSYIPNLNRLVADASAILQFLFDHQIPAEQITLSGMSLGGLVGTILASVCHKKNLPVNLFIMAAPMTLAPCGVNLIHKLRNQIEPTLLTKCLSRILNFYNWDADAITLWNAIPESSKEYWVIGTSDENDIPDNMIPEMATIPNRQQSTHTYDYKHELSEKLSLLGNHETTQQEALLGYKTLLETHQDNTTAHHILHIQNHHQKKRNPHGTMPFLIKNSSSDSSAESLEDGFSAFVKYRNKHTLHR